MRTTERLSASAYADLVRDVAAWVEENTSATYRAIARWFRLTYAEIDDIIGDSEAYGPKLRLRAGVDARPAGSAIVEIEKEQP